MHEVLDVRRFTALDMYGTAGTLRRRRIIRAEFVIGCPALFLVTVMTLRGGHPLLGGWLLGVAVNYLPLAAHSISLFPPGRLEAELSNVDDVRSQLMRAGVIQVLLLVPFLVALAAAVQWLKQRPG